MKDIRVLCLRCADDYRECGYKVYIRSSTKERCDKCGKQGIECELKFISKKARKIGASEENFPEKGTVTRSKISCGLSDPKKRAVLK